MKYDLAIVAEAKEAFTYLEKLSGQHAIAEVKKINPKRSLRQNAYLHLLIGAFGLNFGYTIDEAKIVYKEVNKDIYLYKKKGRVFLRSSADLNKEEMARSIDKFMQKSAEAGYPLPLATDQEWLRQIDNEIERAKHYVGGN